MKKSLVLVGLTIISIIIIHSCALKKVKALAKCEFKFNKVNSFNIAGVNINPSGNTAFNFQDLVKITTAYSKKTLPTNLDVLIDVNNPNSATAKMTRFDWKIDFKDDFLTRGKVDKELRVPGNSFKEFPFQTDFDLYNAVSKYSIDEVRTIITDAFDGNGDPKDLKLYIKPYILGIPYPGFIEMTKHFKSN